MLSPLVTALRFIVTLLAELELDLSLGLRLALRLIATALRLAPERHDLLGGVRRAIGRPRLHQLAALLQRVAAAVGLLGLVADDMRQRGFDQLRAG